MRAINKDDQNPRDLVRQMIRKVIDDFDRQRTDDGIDARIVAERVHRGLDPHRHAPDLVAYCSIDGLTQMSRVELRGKHDLPDDDATSEQLEAFGKTLNERYSIRREEWPDNRYVLRDLISKAEIEQQVLPMMDKHIGARQLHRDTLAAWNATRP
jgi:hypothetical protein